MVAALATMVLPALLPAVADGLKGLFGEFFGGAKPINVDDQVKLITADIAKLQALAALDAPAANISPWVADLRASFRYISAGLIILGTLGFVALYFWFCYADPKNSALPMITPVLDILLQMAGSVFSFMFGDRLYFNLKGK